MRFDPKIGDMLYSAPDRAMGSKPIGRVLGFEEGDMLIGGSANDFKWAMADVHVMGKLPSGGWVIESKFGRTNAPRYWLKGGFLKKIAGVFERQGVYANQVDIRWERDEGGLWAVIRVAIKEDDNARTL